MQAFPFCEAEHNAGLGDFHEAANHVAPAAMAAGTAAMASRQPLRPRQPLCIDDQQIGSIEEDLRASWG
jgi:hypothetical protein